MVPGCPPHRWPLFIVAARYAPHEGGGEGAALRRRVDLLQLLWGEGSAIAHLGIDGSKAPSWAAGPWDQTMGFSDIFWLFVAPRNLYDDPNSC